MSLLETFLQLRSHRSAHHDLAAADSYRLHIIERLTIRSFFVVLHVASLTFCSFRRGFLCIALERSLLELVDSKPRKGVIERRTWSRERRINRCSDVRKRVPSVGKQRISNRRLSPCSLSSFL